MFNYNYYITADATETDLQSIIKDLEDINPLEDIIFQISNSCREKIKHIRSKLNASYERLLRKCYTKLLHIEMCL